MKPVTYERSALCMDGVALADIAEAVATPCYVYSAATLLENYRAYNEAFGDAPHTVCYSVKANGSLGLLRLLARQGAGFDIVSGGELFRVLKAGGDPARVVFSGVGKTAAEINQALDAEIFAFNCESEPELALIDALAHRRSIKARVSLRVNPDVDAGTHDYISTGRLAHKFGVDIAAAEGVYERARGLTNLILEGVSCHIGSSVPDTASLMVAVERVTALVGELRAKGFDIRQVDLGGGLYVAYRPEETTPSICDFIRGIVERLAGLNLHVTVEPGRSIVADAGVLITRVLYRKRNGDKEFVVVDAAMTDLIRPALYKAYHDILPVRGDSRPPICADVVGPVCESGDFLAKDREMAEALPGDLLAVCTAGAYGFVQGSNYNARPRAAEVLVENGSWRVIRKRESYEDLVRGEE